MDANELMAKIMDALDEAHRSIHPSEYEIINKVVQQYFRAEEYFRNNPWG